MPKARSRRDTHLALLLLIQAVRGRLAMTRDITLLELVSAIATVARTDAEVIAAVVYLVNSGKVRLCGNFKGARFRLDDVASDGSAKAVA
jgi:hypothetical protein